jgi:putative FmdB family regulatory protein
MPLYTYICQGCGVEAEHLVRYDDRNNEQTCVCGDKMVRRGLEGFAIGDAPQQMGAIFNDGSRVPGHFGRDAKRRRKK